APKPAPGTLRGGVRRPAPPLPPGAPHAPPRPHPGRPPPPRPRGPAPRRRRPPPLPDPAPPPPRLHPPGAPPPRPRPPPRPPPRPAGAPVNVVRFVVSGPAPAFPGLYADLTFATNTQPGVYLDPGSYQARRYPFQGSAFAGLDVTMDFRGSNQLYGSFTILESV